MFRFSTLLLAATVILQSSISMAADSATREKACLDAGWRFAMGHSDGGARDFDAVPAGAAFNYFSKAGRGEGAAAEKFDDSTWRLLNLPHDWAVELPFDHRGSHSHGYKALGKNFPENSVGWYRRTFDIPQTDLGKRISVVFDGVFRDSQVWVNGFYLGRHSSGYTGFAYDLSDYLNYGGENVISVRVDASLEEGWFYEGAGIYRHVWLEKTSPLHVAHNGTFVRSERDGDDAVVRITTTVKNDGNEAENVVMLSEIVSSEGQTVASHRMNVSDKSVLNPGESRDFDCSIKVEAPRLWSLEDPNLYTLQTTVLKDGQPVDEYTTPFGIRFIEWTGDKGFFLNGKRVEIKGMNNHQDHAGVGAAIPDSLNVERIRMLKAMGVNAYRCSHNPPTPELLDACDRLGMLVMDENRETGINAQQLDSVRDMMLRDRNHPSIIIWSLGNEEWALEGGDKGARVTATMQNFARQFDDTRPFTVAISGGWGAGSSTVVDVMGFNYITHGDTDDYHRRFPNTPTVGTEDGAGYTTRGIYFEDRKNCHLTAYDTNVETWFTPIRVSIPHYLNREWATGQFRWTGFDYRGEPTPFGWPAISSQFGAMDTCGFPKDTYYYYKAWWGSDPVLHLFPHWNWKGREGQPIAVWVYANCNKVELILNGMSLGTKTMEQYGYLEWSVPYAAGTLLAVGYDENGKEVLRDAVETTSEPAAIKLSANTQRLPADGDAVALIRVEVLDADGRPVPTADNRIRFDISGPGRIIGVGNGDPASLEPDQFTEGMQWQRSLFSGLAQVIVQSIRDQEGDIVLTAHGDGLEGTTIHFKAVPAESLIPMVPVKQTAHAAPAKPVPILVEVDMPADKADSE